VSGKRPFKLHGQEKSRGANCNDLRRRASRCRRVVASQGEAVTPCRRAREPSGAIAVVCVRRCTARGVRRSVDRRGTRWGAALQCAGGAARDRAIPARARRRISTL